MEFLLGAILAQGVNACTVRYISDCVDGGIMEVFFSSICGGRKENSIIYGLPKKISSSTTILCVFIRRTPFGAMLASEINSRKDKKIKLTLGA